MEKAQSIQQKRLRSRKVKTIRRSDYEYSHEYNISTNSHDYDF